MDKKEKNPDLLKQKTVNWSKYVKSHERMGVHPEIIKALQSGKCELLNWVKANFVALYLMTLDFLDVDSLNPVTVFKDKSATISNDERT